MMRLDKMLAHLGYGSRKEVKDFIRKGFVMVNGETITNDDFKVDEEKDDVIRVKLINDTEVLKYDVKKITIDKKTNEYEYEVVNSSELAFDHEEIIVKGIMDLRYKVNSTDIVFNLMPEEFTIGELKQVYSLLLGKELVNSAFRRVIAPKIVETGTTEFDLVL